MKKPGVGLFVASHFYCILCFVEQEHLEPVNGELVGLNERLHLLPPVCLHRVQVLPTEIHRKDEEADVEQRHSRKQLLKEPKALNICNLVVLAHCAPPVLVEDGILLHHFTGVLHSLLSPFPLTVVGEREHTLLDVGNDVEEADDGVEHLKL